MSTHCKSPYTLFRIGLIVTQTGNAATSNVVNALVDEVAGTVKESHGRLINVREDIEHLPKFNDDQGLKNQFNDIISEFDDIHDSVDRELRDAIKEYNGYRQIVIHVGSIVPIVIIGAGFIFMLFGRLFPLSILGWLAMFLSIIAWILLVAHVVAGVVISDLCYEIDLGVETGDLGPIYAFLPYDNEGDIFGELKQTTTKKLTETRLETCNQIDAFCNGKNCEPEYDDSTCNMNDNYISGVPDIEFTIDGATTTIGECGNDDTCTDNSNAKGLLEISNYQGRYATFVDSVHKNLDHTFILAAFESIKINVCDKSVSAFEQIFSGNALIAIAMVVGSILMVHIFKGSKGKQDDTMYEMN